MLMFDEDIIIVTTFNFYMFKQIIKLIRVKFIDS